jgi:hypothetical protein
MLEYKPSDAIDFLCNDASVKATLWAKDDGLHPAFTEHGDRIYTEQQGYRAAHCAREDSAAALILMRPTLYKLRSIQRLLWVVIFFLAAICWKLWDR